MYTLNWIFIICAGFIPLALGGIWYGPLFGNAWMSAADMSVEKAQSGNMVKIFGLTLLLGIMLAIGLLPIVIHQMGIFSVLQGSSVEISGSEANLFVKDFMSKYGNNFRTFKHGALHGFITGLLIFLPIMATNALFERKSWKYILINVGFWAVSAMLMGGVICAWA